MEPLVLGIETSCDETGVGIVRGHTLLADAVASSVDEHARFGGVVPEVAIDTPWVSVPGLLTGKCTSNDNASGYLEVTVNGNPSDPRADDITGDIGVGTNVLANWGLHLIDVNLSMGNLLDIVGQQTKAYLKKK